jgi:hypothetical protein
VVVRVEGRDHDGGDAEDAGDGAKNHVSHRQSSTAKVFIAGGLPRGGGIVKLQPQERQR